MNLLFFLTDYNNKDILKLFINKLNKNESKKLFSMDIRKIFKSIR